MEHYLLAGNTTIETDTASSTTLDGNITIDGTIDGAKTLTLQSGAGDIDISNLIGNSTAFLSTVAINTTTAVGNEANRRYIAIAGVGKANLSAAGTAANATFSVGNTT